MATQYWSPLEEIESHFNHTSAIAFMNQIWHYSFYISIFYVISIFSLQSYMKTRVRFNLRGPLMVWSLVLASFSLYGFYVAGLQHWTYAYNHGWKRSVCDSILVERRYGLWSFLFCFSKCPELIDTYFIILRKQKLIFLHWYHHITVFIYCWYSYAHLNNPQQWFITMNYFVHSIMYLYYAIRASSFYRPPVWVNIFITSLQLLQMVIGVWVNVYLYINMKTDPEWFCDDKIEGLHHIYIAFVMYSSYFVLFVHFFYSSYLNKKMVASARNVGREQLRSNGFYNGNEPVSNGNGLLDSHGPTAMQEMVTSSKSSSDKSSSSDRDVLTRYDLHFRK